VAQRGCCPVVVSRGRPQAHQIVGVHPGGGTQQVGDDRTRFVAAVQRTEHEDLERPSGGALILCEAQGRVEHRGRRVVVALSLVPSGLVERYQHLGLRGQGGECRGGCGERAGLEVAGRSRSGRRRRADCG
jgi:hypothetical protein